MNTQSINDIIGTKVNTFVQGTMVGKFISITKNTDYQKFKFKDMSNGKVYELTIFENNIFHSKIVNFGLTRGDYFKLEGAFKMTSTNYLNLGDGDITTPTEDEVPKCVDDEDDASKEQAGLDITYIKDVVDNKIIDPTIKNLVSTMISQHMPDMVVTAGAISWHHNYKRGLIKHVVEVIKYAEAICNIENISDYEMDLMYAGVLFHDIGKIYQLKYVDGAIEPTTKGALLGHIVGGVFILLECANKNEIHDMYNDKIILNLSHIILSHHGIPDWGSPEKPVTKVAHIIHHADNMSAKISVVGDTKIKGDAYDNGLYNHSGFKVNYVDVSEQS